MRLVIAILLVSAIGHADPDPAQADALFRKGNDLLAVGKIAEACAAFDESQRLDPTVSNKLHQANCREKNAQLVTAWRMFLDAERSTKVATDDATRLLHKIAADRAAKLEVRLSTLTIAVSDPRGLEIKRNGAIVDPSLWNKAVPVDGGRYVITTHAPGNAEWSTTVTVGNERDAKTVETPRLRPATRTPTPAPVSDDTPAPPRAERALAIPIAFGAAAVVAAGAAVGFELWGDSTYAKSKLATEPAQTSLWHSANDKRYAAEGLAIVGVGCAVAAVWLYLHGSAEGTVQVAHISAQPFVAADRTGLQLVGHW